MSSRIPPDPGRSAGHQPLQPIALAEPETRFQACGRWRERLPTILNTLAAPGRACVVADRAAGDVPRRAAGSNQRRGALRGNAEIRRRIDELMKLLRGDD